MKPAERNIPESLLSPASTSIRDEICCRCQAAASSGAVASEGLWILYVALKFLHLSPLLAQH